MYSMSENDRLAACWKVQDCYSCLHSKAGCGWCPSSSTCIPASSLLSPLKYPICPLLSERYELRTRALGCGCSTTTFLSIIITILCTLFATLLIYGIWKAQILQWLWRIFGPGAWEGWERVEVEEGGEVIVREGAWRRGGRGGKWGFKLFSGLADDERSIEERRRLLGGT